MSSVVLSPNERITAFDYTWVPCNNVYSECDNYIFRESLCPKLPVLLIKYDVLLMETPGMATLSSKSLRASMPRWRLRIRSRMHTASGSSFCTLPPGMARFLHVWVAQP